jgi:hypothetical protein
MTGTIWATRIIYTMWQQIFEGWELHNTKVHGDKHKQAVIDLRRRIISKVYHLHSRRHEVLADHHDYLFLSDLKQTIRTATLNFLRNWIRLYEPSILESIHVAQSNAVKNTRSLSKYFRALPSKRPPKPRFDQRHRLLIDGRKKVRKRRKVTHNPTRNRITRHFHPCLRPDSTRPPRRQPFSPPLIPNLRNPYAPFHPTQNLRQPPDPNTAPNSPTRLPNNPALRQYPSQTALGIRTLPAQLSNTRPATNANPSTPAIPQIRNPYARSLAPVTLDIVPEAPKTKKTIPSRPQTQTFPAPPPITWLCHIHGAPTSVADRVRERREMIST